MGYISLDDAFRLVECANLASLGEIRELHQDRDATQDAARGIPLVTQGGHIELDALLRLTPTHAAGKKLQDVIKSCRRRMFVSLADRAIPPTNNGSEQALRPCVIFRKVTNCFRSEWAAQFYAGGD